MKKMIFAALLVALSVTAIAQGFFGRRGGACCPPACAAPCETVCPQQECQPECFRTVMVPVTTQVPKLVRVPAREIIIPQPDICIRIPVPARMIRIPVPPTVIQNPDIIKWECQPDRIEYRKQAPLRRWECPPGTEQGCNGCAPACCPPAC